jgi:glycosyltransferase involved in cell wall biosynthesis
MKYRVAFVSVVPSPYQRELFGAVARLPEIDLRVFYMEAAAPDSPWPEKPLASYESILPGFWLPVGSARVHVNSPLPSFWAYDLVVLNALLSSATAQRLMRLTLRKQPWIFWGERLRERTVGWKKTLHDFLIAPLHSATAIVSIGSRAERDYRRRFPEPKHFCIPYFTELKPFIDVPRVPPEHDGEIVFLFCGQMIARKGVDVLLKAFSAVAGKNRHAKLLLVGREAELRLLLRDVPEDVRSRVEYAGFQPPEALPRYFARADVFVLPSRYDGWGVVVNQAIGAGLPVLCSDAVGAGDDLVEDDANGAKFPADDAAALAGVMQRLVDDPHLRTAWAAESRRKSADWIPERGAEKWLEVFQATLNP